MDKSTDHTHGTRYDRSDAVAALPMPSTFWAAAADRGARKCRACHRRRQRERRALARRGLEGK